MSSTDLDAPPLRSILIAIIIVVTLHVLTAVALVAIKPPEIKVEPEKDTPPIEIEMVTLPPPPVEVEEKKVEDKKSEPVSKVKSQPKAASIKKHKPKPPKVKDTKKTPLSTPGNSDLPDEPPPESTNNLSDNSNTPKLGGIVDSSSTTVIQKNDVTVQKPTTSTHTSNNKPTKPTSSGGDSAVNNKSGDDEVTEAPVDKGPVSFGASEATWKPGHQPNLSFLKGERRRLKKDISITVKIIVDEKGNIESAVISSGTGNKNIDSKIRKAIKKARLNPFIKNGVAVKGTVTLPVVYEIK
ncbi:energy transducer TonB family protein [Psychrobacter sp. AOP22-C1-22]|uniref:energy transducer TonB family protein n=1 Tax=unclassified Psychrobacter TaxID=196806 RepID=UPI001788690A|nr:energy transducer TonB [Psychrobacter sp. FME6]MBE0407539.1 energy transducer TonB [Psychrobacter sp. FME6]